MDQFNKSAYTAMEEQQLQGQPYVPQKMPKRSHKTWLYRQHVRRYDHYCRWVTNVIGLLNHREFFVMVICLVLIALVGGAIDLIACIPAFSRPSVTHRVLILSHLAYSCILAGLAGPILKVHVGLVGRNELANEWKRNDFYVVAGKNGELIQVNDLSDDDFNERFDNFTYDKRRNPWDKGWSTNCWSFWCTPRWSIYLCSPLKTGTLPEQLGEFYGSLCKDFPLLTIEDPFDQDDWDGWTKMTAAVGEPTQIVGDDLTVTNVERVKTAIENAGLPNEKGWEMRIQQCSKGKDAGQLKLQGLWPLWTEQFHSFPS